MELNDVLYLVISGYLKYMISWYYFNQYRKALANTYTYYIIALTVYVMWVKQSNNSN